MTKLLEDIYGYFLLEDFLPLLSSRKKLTKNSGIIETKNVQTIRMPRQFSSDQPEGFSFLYYTQAWNVMEN